MGRIISDISKREIIVEGIDEVERIEHINRNKCIVNIEIIAKDIYKVSLIGRVGTIKEI